MSLIDHPNVIRAYCSFVVEHSLWVIMPFMTEGSCLHLMKISYQEGFDEPVIGSILKETLKALDYLHRQGQIHRDVKVSISRMFLGRKHSHLMYLLVIVVYFCLIRHCAGW
jgi:serine/threonine protein kinase